MDNPHDLQSWPEFEAAARKADALWSNLNMDERQAIKDDIAMPPDVAVHLMQKALHDLCHDIRLWEANAGRGTLIEFKISKGLTWRYVHQFPDTIEILSGSVIKDIILAVADFYEKHVAPTIR